MILFRYLSKEVLLNTFAVSVTLLVIVMSGRFVKYLADAASGDLSPDILLTIMFYRVPGFLELVLPLGFFIGILLAYGRLYVDSEMTVMSACGLSVSRLAVYTLMPALALAMLVAYISLFASPVGMAKVNDIYEDVKASSGLESLVEGRFRVDKKTGRVTYVQAFDSKQGLMQDIFTAEPRIDNEGRLLHTVVLAERGYIDVLENYGGRYLILENGHRYRGRAGDFDYAVTEFSKFGQFLNDPVSSGQAHLRGDAKPTIALLSSDKLADIATLQWRISLPILVPVIALIALSLSKTNHRRGRYVKMLPAFLIYIFYVLALSAARNSLEKGNLSPELGLWSVHLLFLALALLLLYGEGLGRQIKMLATGRHS